MSRPSSLRWYWCVGCGQWHDPLQNQSGAHYSMYVPQQEPTESNFEGDAADLQRFLAARRLKEEDAEKFETRVDAALLTVEQLEAAGLGGIGSMFEAMGILPPRETSE